MKISKNAEICAGGGVSEEQLAKINRFAKTPLRAEEVYVFPVLLCDNEIDRDFERFTESALEELGRLFLGKTGIFDHQWTTKGQKARLFETETVRDGGRKNALGHDYVNLKGWAYMLRSPENEGLIAEIEAGIKREVSVGCSVAETVCSVCGKSLGSGECGHIKGRKYGGKLCWAELCEPTDAYEWSFVAVPAQKNAGVIKKFGKGGGKMTLESFLGENEGEGYMDELCELKKNAELGKRYLTELRGEVVKLGLMAEDKFRRETLEGAAEKMDEPELLGFKQAFSRRLDEIYPVSAQLGARKGGKSEIIREYLV